MKRQLINIYRLGIKELWSLIRDPVMLFLIAFTFTISVYTAATAVPDSLNMAQVAIVDEDDSPLSKRISSAFYPPYFSYPSMIGLDQMDRGMDTGEYTFVIDIPPNFQKDILAGREPTIQINVDATRMSQSFTGNGYIQQMLSDEVSEYLASVRQPTSAPVDLALRMRFNPTLAQSWFGALMQVINNITMLSIILTGAALIRERERGTVEHLLVMPITPKEIMLSKVWSMALVVLLAATFSLMFVVRGVLKIPIEGSMALFLFGATLHLFATTSMGIFLATIARNMPQFGMLLMLILLPLQMLSGGVTPRESMPEFVQNIMLIAPTTHFIELGQGILYRGAGISVVWGSFVWLLAIGSVFFFVSLTRFRNTISKMT